jgi:hypothetical protein
MYKISFTLKQQTPLIHFQHEQEGATLRATEVKPKLDRFIITQLGEGNYENGVLVARNRHWIIGDKDVSPLDYKLIIAPVYSNKKIIGEGRNNSMEPFFGNLGQEYIGNEKALVYSDEIIVASIMTTNKALYDELIYSEKLVKFFALNNFGTRQSKGFGSFTIREINKVVVKFPSSIYSFYFDLPIEGNAWFETYKAIFKKVNLFYKAIRSGLNEIRGQAAGAPRLYFKSLLYQYVAYYLNSQWDKKTVKKHFLNAKQTTECVTYADDIVCNANTQNSNLDYKNFKALFGLSSLESWGQVFTLKKTQARFDVGSNRWVKISNVKDIEISRFKSPMFFKIVRLNNAFRVYFNFQIDTHSYQEYTNTVFCIERSNSPSSFMLPFFQNFDYNHFMNWVLDNVDIENRFTENTSGTHREFNQIISTLTDIFEQIKNNRINN